jgi:hypothetical protein
VVLDEPQVNLSTSRPRRHLLYVGYGYEKVMGRWRTHWYDSYKLATLPQPSGVRETAFANESLWDSLSIAVRAATRKTIPMSVAMFEWNVVFSVNKSVQD